MDAYLSNSNDFSNLSKSQREKKKIQLSLLIDTMYNLLPSGKTIYRLQPEDWELSFEI